MIANFAVARLGLISRLKLIYLILTTILLFAIAVIYGSRTEMTGADSRSAKSFFHWPFQSQSNFSNRTVPDFSAKNGSRTGLVDPRPNIILINLDDADRESLEIDFYRHDLGRTLLPNVKRLATEGLRFSNCHCAIPFCNPSRVCLFTGQYAFKTNVRHNAPKSPLSRGVDGGFIPFRDAGPFGDTRHPYLHNELGNWMRKGGYDTMFVGKYLHDDYLPGVGETWEDITPPGWEHFFCSNGASYFRTMFVEQGQISFADKLDPSQFPNRYRTAVEGQKVCQLIQSHVQQSDPRPFFVYFAPVVPHRENSDEMCMKEDLPDCGMVENCYKKLLPDLKQNVDLDFDEADVSDKPLPVQGLRRLTDQGDSPDVNDRLMMDLEYRRRILAMISFDDALGDLLKTLETTKTLDNTVILLTSDHGFQLGQQRHFGKVFPYNRVSSIPLIAWCPSRISARAELQHHLLSNIDFAPTILDLAKLPIPAEVQGVSFVSLLSKPEAVPADQWRPEGVLVECWGRAIDRNMNYEHTFESLHLPDAIYTQWATGDQEYYDLTQDPYQLVNQYPNLPPDKQRRLKENLEKLKRPMPAPQGFIDYPNSAKNLYFQGADLNGIAEYRGPIQEVQLWINERNSQSARFWNGKDWQSEPTFVKAKLDSSDNLITNWNYRFEPKCLVDTQYRVTVRVLGADGRPQRTPGMADFWVVTDYPFAQVTFPDQDDLQRYGMPIKLQGIAEGPEAFRSVNLFIRNQDNQFWNGDSWQSQSTQVPAKIFAILGSVTHWKYEMLPTETVGTLSIWATPVSTSGQTDLSPQKHTVSWHR